MGTRINYEIMLRDDSAPCAILYSDNSDPEEDPEMVFLAHVEAGEDPATLVASLLRLAYPMSAGGAVRIYGPDGVTPTEAPA